MSEIKAISNLVESGDRSLAPRFHQDPMDGQTTTVPLVPLPASPLQLTDAQAGVSLRYFGKRIRRYTWTIAGVIAVALAGTFCVTSLLTPLYESTVTLKVERRSNNGYIGVQALMPPAGDSDQLMNTQLDLIQSDSVLRPATEQFHLLELEHQYRGLSPEEQIQKKNSPIKLKRLTVTRLPNTYILRLTYRAPDAALAANVVNTIAGSYIAHAFDTRDRSSDLVAQVVNRQMEDLRNKMTASAQALVQFEKELKVVDPEARVSMLSSRLLQLNTDYTSAQADRLRKQAVLEATKAGSIAAAEASGHGQPLERLVDRTNEARQQFAAVRSIYGENHPEFKRALTEKNELEAQLKDLQSNSQQRVESDYHQALTREQLSGALLAETRNEVERLSARSYDYVELKREAGNYKKLYDDLQRVTREDEINRSFQDNIIQVADPARPGGKPVTPNLAINLAVAFLLSGFLGLLGCTMHDTWTAKLVSAEDAKHCLNLNVLGTVPKFNKSQLLLPGRSEESTALVAGIGEGGRESSLDFEDAIRHLRNTVDLSATGSKIRSLLLTSSVAGEGKSTIASGLALAYATAGRKTLVIDADLRRPSLHTLFGTSRESGLSDVLSGTATWGESLVKVAREPLYFLPAGKFAGRALDRIGTAFPELLADLYSEFDMVIIDGPPLLGVPETMHLAKCAGGVLMVARSGSAKVALINEAASPLVRVHANVVGLVLNQVKQDRLFRELRYYRTATTEAA